MKVSVIAFVFLIAIILFLKLNLSAVSAVLNIKTRVSIRRVKLEPGGSFRRRAWENTSLWQDVQNLSARALLRRFLRRRRTGPVTTAPADTSNFSIILFVDLEFVSTGPTDQMGLTIMSPTMGNPSITTLAKRPLTHGWPTPLGTQREWPPNRRCSNSNSVKMEVSPLKRRRKKRFPDSVFTAGICSVSLLALGLA